MYEIRMTDSWSVEDKSLQWSERDSSLSLWCVYEFLVLVLGFAASFLATVQVQTGVVAANERVLITVGLCLALELCKYPSFEGRVGLQEYFKMADFIDFQSISFWASFFPTGRNKTCFFVLRNQEKTRHRFRARSECLFISYRFPWIVIRINVLNYCNYFVMRSKSCSDNQRDGLSVFFILQVTSLITGFVCKLHTSLSNSLYLKQLAQIGFLAHFESLLTTNGRLGFSLQILFKSRITCYNDVIVTMPENNMAASTSGKNRPISII